MVDVRPRPPRRQLEVLRAYIATGSITAAARELDIADATARQHLSGLYRRTGSLNVAQAAYRLGRADREIGRRSGTAPGSIPHGGDPRLGQSDSRADLHGGDGTGGC
jgi:hypothetical protein